tara:strand:+ start:48 stop:749 length:702 start_codon:yes stop_codon:yes gene_type:complete
MNPLTAGIGAAGSVLSSVIGNIGAKKREANARKANVEFWKMQNQYNTPKAQMRRLKDAGLNPNLIYGSSPANAGGNAGDISPAKAAPYTFDNPINSVVQMGLAPLQGGKILAETANTIKKAGLTDLNTKLLSKNFDSLAELQEYKTQSAYQQLLQDTIATNVADKTQIPMIENSIAQLALTNAKASKEKAAANIEQWKSDLADKGVNINDNLIFRLLALAANAMGINPENLFN